MVRSCLHSLFFKVRILTAEISTTFRPVIFGGAKKKIARYSNFCYYASQLRIRIEMAFGLMVMKWCILWRPINIRMNGLKLLVLAIAKVHNFCINERVGMGLSLNPSPDTELDKVFDLHTQAQRDDAADREATADLVPGWSLMREQMVNLIEELGLERPEANKLNR